MVIVQVVLNPKLIRVKLDAYTRGDPVPQKAGAAKGGPTKAGAARAGVAKAGVVPAEPAAKNLENPVAEGAPSGG